MDFAWFAEREWKRLGRVEVWDVGGDENFREMIRRGMGSGVDVVVEVREERVYEHLEGLEYGVPF